MGIAGESSKCLLRFSPLLGCKEDMGMHVLPLSLVAEEKYFVLFLLYIRHSFCTSEIIKHYQVKLLQTYLLASQLASSELNTVVYFAEISDSLAR